MKKKFYATDPLIIYIIISIILAIIAGISLYNFQEYRRNHPHHIQYRYGDPISFLCFILILLGYIFLPRIKIDLNCNKVDVSFSQNAIYPDQIEEVTIVTLTDEEKVTLQYN